MKLVWTFDGNAKIGRMDVNRKIILINYYIHSIQTAKSLNYYTIIYTDIDSVKFFINIADDVIVMDSYENSELWDSYKIKVLEERLDDFCLIDGDVILNSKLPEFNTEIVFDTYEIANWDIEYKKTVNKLDSLNIIDVIKEWDSYKKPIINCGILYIKSNDIKQLYVNRWKSFNNWFNKNKNIYDLDVDYCTMIGAQYLLTLLVNYYNISSKNINKNMGDNSNYYKHHFGKIKYDSPIVPSDKIISNFVKNIM
jgi:hypothetical protein